VQNVFPPLILNDWRATRDTLQLYSQLLGKVRRALAPPHSQWWHITLHVDANGLTTTPIPTENPFELRLNLRAHTLEFHPIDGVEHNSLPLENQSAHSVAEWMLNQLAIIGVKPEIDCAPFSSNKILPYDAGRAEIFFTALKSIDHTFRQFKSELPGETSPVQIFPHHFDVSLVWFTGRQVVVPAGEEGGAEQVGFGFSTGDDTLPEAYFYATPWLAPAGLADTPLPVGASWQTTGWTGGLLPYHTLAKATQPGTLLLDFLRAVQHNSAKLMSDTSAKK